MLEVTPMTRLWPHLQLRNAFMHPSCYMCLLLCAAMPDAEATAVATWSLPRCLRPYRRLLLGHIAGSIKTISTCQFLLPRNAEEDVDTMYRTNMDT